MYRWCMRRCLRVAKCKIQNLLVSNVILCGKNKYRWPATTQRTFYSKIVHSLSKEESSNDLLCRLGSCLFFHISSGLLELKDYGDGRPAKILEFEHFCGKTLRRNTRSFRQPTDENDGQTCWGCYSHQRRKKDASIRKALTVSRCIILHVCPTTGLVFAMTAGPLERDL